MKIILLFSPLFILFCFCSHSSQQPGKTDPAFVSPDGRYSLSLSIIRNEHDGFKAWYEISIRDVRGSVTVLSSDEFPARFRIYHAWDDSGRVWVYNSDDGAVYFWSENEGSWIKHGYDDGQYDFMPPGSLIPDY